jgi:hypothetical protein
MVYAESAPPPTCDSASDDSYEEDSSDEDSCDEDPSPEDEASALHDGTPESLSDDVDAALSARRIGVSSSSSEPPSPDPRGSKPSGAGRVGREGASRVEPRARGSCLATSLLSGPSAFATGFAVDFADEEPP